MNDYVCFIRIWILEFLLLSASVIYPFFKQRVELHIQIVNNLFKQLTLFHILLLIILLLIKYTHI